MSNKESNIDDQLLNAVSERIADAKINQQSILITYRFHILLSVIGVCILALLVYLAMNQEQHNLVSTKEAEAFCLNMARASGTYPKAVKAEELSLIDHEKYHQCVDYHVGKDSELLKEKKDTSHN